jgi:hypothetical protein
MDEIKNKIIQTLNSWNEGHPFKEGLMEYTACWKGYRRLSKDTGEDVKILKKAMKSLKEEGKVELLHTSNDESRVAGSGWFLVNTL